MRLDESSRIDKDDSGFNSKRSYIMEPKRKLDY